MPRISCQWEMTYIAAFTIIIRCRRRSRFGICICGLIVDGGQSVGLVCQITVGAKIRSHPVSRAGLSDTGDDNITALTNPERNNVGSIRLNRDEIVCNNGHIVAINSKALDSFGTAVDEPESVLLSRVEFELGETCVRRASLTGGDQGAIVVHLAIDEIVVGEWWGASGCLHDLFDNLEIFGMIPIA